MENQGYEYTIDMSANAFREHVEGMRAGDEFSDFHSTDISSSSFWAKTDKPEENIYYLTRITIKPQENSVRIRVFNEYGEGKKAPMPFLAWERIRKDLERSARKVVRVDGLELAAVFEHSYIDPGTISNPEHRKIIKALIAAESSSKRTKQYEIAKEVGYSPARVSEVKAMYKRPEFKEENS